MTIDTAKLRASTKSLLGVVLSAAAVFQIPDVETFVLSLVLHHPRATAACGVFFGFATILHNPRVMEALGIKETVTVEKVALDPEPHGDS